MVVTYKLRCCRGLTLQVSQHQAAEVGWGERIREVKVRAHKKEINSIPDNNMTDDYLK